VRVGIVGSGRIGGTLGGLLVGGGDEVTLANSRGPQSWPTGSPRWAAARARRASLPAPRVFGGDVDAPRSERARTAPHEPAGRLTAS
jgi:predicted dinucleotide-binding enzyme